MLTTITSLSGAVLRTLDSAQTREAAEFDAIALPGSFCHRDHEHHEHAVRGVNARSHSHHSDADALCVHCNEVIGRIRVDLDTLFGREEDEAVLHGRPRVY